MTKTSQQLEQAAYRLSNNEDFRLFMTQTREQAISAFENSGIEQTTIREEAHATIRTLNRIQQMMDIAVQNAVLETHQEKKGQDRNDD